MSSQESPQPSILIVDDTPQNLQLAGEALSQDLICEISFATGGAQALVSARELLPDLILLDIMMPDMEGFEVCRQLKADALTAEIPIIFLTARGEVDDVVKGFEVGGADYVTKPFRRAELVTRVRTQLQAQEARRIIEKKNDQLGQLMQILCHDLANPVAAIYSLLDLVGDDTDLFLELKPDLVRTTTMTLDLIRMVREMRRLEDSGGNLAIYEIPLADAVESVLHVLQEKVKDKEIAITMEIEPCLYVMAEPISFVHSVLANLLTNAVKFSPRGSAVKLCAKSESDGRVRIEVRDRGIGMKPELVEVIFKAGAQIHRQGTESEPGTGYGMHLVKKFMDAYGGDAYVESWEQSRHPDSHGTTVGLILKGGMKPEQSGANT